MSRKTSGIIKITFITIIIVLCFQMNFFTNLQLDNIKNINISNIGITLSNKDYWKFIYNSSVDNRAYDLAFDSNNNIYLVGQTDNEGICNTLTLKFNPNGDHQWGKTWDSLKDDCGIGIVIDPSDNIYVVGFADSKDDYTEDIYLLKYNSDGDLIRHKILCSVDGMIPSNIAMDSLNNIYITGYREISASEAAIFLLKYDNSGSLQWQRYWHESNIDIGYDIAIDSSDNIYITGTSMNLSSERAGICLIKYSDQGAQLWNKTWQGSEINYGNGIALDSEDNVYVCGKIENKSSGIEDSCIIKFNFNNNGSVIWSSSFDQSIDEWAQDLVICDNYIHIIGHYSVIFNYTEVNCMYYSLLDMNGGLKCTEYHLFGYQYPISINKDNLNNVYITGSRRGSDYADCDIFLIKDPHFADQETNDNGDDNRNNENNENNNPQNEDTEVEGDSILLLILIVSIIIVLIIAIMVLNVKNKNKNINQKGKVPENKIVEPEWDSLSAQLQFCYDKIINAGKIPRLGLIKDCLKTNYNFTENMYGYEKFKRVLEQLLLIYPAFNIKELSRNEYILKEIED